LGFQVFFSAIRELNFELGSGSIIVDVMEVLSATCVVLVSNRVEKRDTSIIASTNRVST
jgi:hypothetical protein